MCRRKLSYRTIFIDNIGTMSLWILASLLLIQINWWYLIPFWIYVPFSVVWFWRFICTYCAHYGTGCCPCGYGHIAAKVFLFRDETQFKKRFNQNIGMVMGYWIVPTVAGIYLMIYDYSLISLIIFIAVIIDGYILIPVISRNVGCKECPTRDECPWIGEDGTSKRPMIGLG
jgi:uncharacterized membrane protein